MPTNEIKVLPGIREEQRIALPSGATIPTAHLVDASGETLGTSGNPLHVHGNTGGGGGGDATAANQLTEIERLDTLVARTPALVNGASPITATPRVCLGTARVTVTTSSQTLAALVGGTIPAGAVTAEIQADGGTVRLRRDGGTPTSTLGYRLDDGAEKLIDTPLADVRLISGGASSVFANVAFFDRV